MSTDPNAQLSAILWGTSTGGNAGSSETTSTLGTSRLNTRIVPDSYHLDNEQITHFLSLLFAISTTFKGGTRLGVLTQTATPFSQNEQGFWTNPSGFPVYSYNGANFYVNRVSYNSQSGANVNSTNSDTYIGMANSGVRTLTLGLASTYPPGVVITVKDENGNAATNNITITHSGSDTIDGASSKVINSNFGVARLVCDGVSKWFTV